MAPKIENNGLQLYKHSYADDTSYTVFLQTFFQFFVTLVTVMTTSIVTIFYVCLLPHVYENSMPMTVFHLIFGHWLLANIVFHYVMAVFTQPGTPPDQVSYVYVQYNLHIETNFWIKEMVLILIWSRYQVEV